MKVKVYTVSQVDDDGSRVIAVRLTYAAALAIMRLNGGRKVERFTATKSDLEDQRQQGDSSHGNPRVNAERRSELHSQV